MDHTTTCTAGQIGGFAHYHRTKARFAFPLPEDGPLEAMGPLLCGGATTFSPFVDFDVKPWHRVAVVGIGGLGHLAVQWAAKWGCEVCRCVMAYCERKVLVGK